MKPLEIGPVVQSDDHIARGEIIHHQFTNLIIFLVGQHGDDGIALAGAYPV